MPTIEFYSELILLFWHLNQQNNLEKFKDVGGRRDYMVPNVFGIGYAPPQPVQCAPPVLNETQRLQAELDCRFRYQCQETDAAIYRKSQESKIEVNRSEEIAKRRSDVASRRELQKTSIYLGTDGSVGVHRELFNEDMKGRLPIRIERTARLIPISSEQEAEVLFVHIVTDKGRESDMYLRNSALEDRIIRRKFAEAGVSFGFGSRKEMEIMRRLIICLMEEAQLLKIPVRHGWYIEDGKVSYAFPQTIVWNEVMQLCH